MKLVDYLTQAQISRSEFAKQLGVTPSYISLLADGKRGASLDTLRRIAALTGGEVTLEDFEPVRNRPDTIRAAS